MSALVRADRAVADQHFLLPLFPLVLPDELIDASDGKPFPPRLWQVILQGAQFKPKRLTNARREDLPQELNGRPAAAGPVYFVLALLSDPCIDEDCAGWFVDEVGLAHGLLVQRHEQSAVKSEPVDVAEEIRRASVRGDEGLFGKPRHKVLDDSARQVQVAVMPVVE